MGVQLLIALEYHGISQSTQRHLDLAIFPQNDINFFWSYFIFQHLYSKVRGVAYRLVQLLHEHGSYSKFFEPYFSLGFLKLL